MTNSVNSDQLASSTDLDLHCLQRQGISGFSRARVKYHQNILNGICVTDTESVSKQNKES